MTWRVLVQHDFAIQGVSVLMGQRLEDGRMMVVGPMDPAVRVMDQAESAAVGEPSLRLTDDQARALLDALAAHYGGAVDVRTSRQDLLAERSRADRLIDALISVATGRPRS